MRRLAVTLALAVLGVNTAQGSPFTVTESKANLVIQIQDMELAVPTGWKLEQDAEDQGTIILGFANGDEYMTFYVKPQFDLDMHDVFANGSRIERDVFDYPRASFPWKAMQTSKSSNKATNYMTSFSVDFEGFTYFGYSRGETADRSLEVVNTFLTNIR